MEHTVVGLRAPTIEFACHIERPRLFSDGRIFTRNAQIRKRELKSKRRVGCECNTVNGSPG